MITNNSIRELITPAILAGGLGTRLQSVVSDLPKVLASVANVPFIHHLLDQLQHFGFDSVVLLTGYKADVVQSTLGYQYKNLLLNYSCEALPLGTGGAVRNSLDMVSTPYLLLLNGDSYCEVDLHEFIDFHLDRQSKCSMVLVKTEDGTRFGSVEMDANQKVTSFSEKTGEHSSWINAGIYLIHRDCINGIKNGSIISLEKDLFPGWVKSPGIWGFSTLGRFIDIGIPDSFAMSQLFFA